jgi:hypothetical protein
MPEQIPSKNEHDLLSLLDESRVRTALRAVQNFAGEESSLAQSLATDYDGCVKACSGGDYYVGVVLDGEEAALARQSLRSMYEGFPYSTSVDYTVRSWTYGDRLEAQNILSIKESPERFPDDIVALPVSPQGVYGSHEAEVRHDTPARAEDASMTLTDRFTTILRRLGSLVTANSD